MPQTAGSPQTANLIVQPRGSGEPVGQAIHPLSRVPVLSVASARSWAAIREMGEVRVEIFPLAADSPPSGVLRCGGPRGRFPGIEFLRRLRRRV